MAKVLYCSLKVGEFERQSSNNFDFRTNTSEKGTLTLIGSEG